MNWFDAVMMDPLMGGANILRVGKAPGMYNTIQDAVDAVENPSETNPWTIIVAPGEYEEYVDLYQDEDHKKSHVSLYLLPGAKVKSPPYGVHPPKPAVRLHDHCQLHGGCVENMREAADAHAVGTTRMDAGVSEARGIVIQGVSAGAAAGRAFEILTDATVVGCLATGGATGFHGSFSDARITYGQNIYFLHCAAFVTRNDPQWPLRAMHVDWHGYEGDDLSLSGVVHFIGCIGLAYSRAPQSSTNVRGLFVEDGNVVVLGSHFAGLTGNGGSAVGIEARGAWIRTVASNGGIARFLASSAAGVAEGDTVAAYGLSPTDLTVASGRFAARGLGSQAGWPQQPFDVEGACAVWPGGHDCHMVTPISSAIIAQLDRARALVVFDTTNGVLKYCTPQNSTLVWKTIASE